MLRDVESHTIKSNGFFGILEEPVPHNQHTNQQLGLDLYIKVLNLRTGEVCFKKMYKNTKGLYFKHTGYSPMYPDTFDRFVTYIPYQIIHHEEGL